MARTKQSLKHFFDAADQVVQVQLTQVEGSSPRDAGTLMYVGVNSVWGTIGGGQLEYMMIDHARKLLATSGESDVLSISLGPEIGQCCGGKVTITLGVMQAQHKHAALQRNQSELANLPQVYVLGAGHVGRAVSDLLQHLPVACVLIDSRTDELEKSDANVEKRLCAIPEHDIHQAKANSAFVIATHDHALDFILTGAALARRDAAYVGMIGSQTKRIKFTRWFKQYGEKGNIDHLVCPMGDRTITDKRPSVIATFIVAQVMGALLQGSQEFSDTEPLSMPQN